MKKFKKLLAIGLATIVTLTTLSFSINALTTKKTVIKDNFNYLNYKTWNVGTWSEVGEECPKDINYTLSNAIVNSGKLKLNISQNKFMWYKPSKTNGAEVRSRNTYGYGYYETKMKPTGASGVISSFYLYADDADEIDIEFVGKDTTRLQINIFNKGTQSGVAHYVDLGFDASKDYHTYGIQWEKDYITWYVDGNEVYKLTSKDCTIPTSNMHMAMDYWVINNNYSGMIDWAGKYNGTTSINTYYDYVSYSTTN